MAIGDGERGVHFDHVSKCYARRGRHDSLRDTVPALARRLVRPGYAVGEQDSGTTWALCDVSFSVRPGEALGIIGHNGGGKSTILKLLAGVTAPTRGRTRVCGRLAALIELGAGFHPDLTGRENVYLNGSILGLTRAEINRKLESIVDFAGLDRFIDTPVKYYSTGMYARLGFAVVAHVEPEVLLIDEVLSVGDYSFQQKCLRRMEAFRRDDVAIVFVSHNLHAVANLCSQAILIQAGRVVAAGTPADVISVYTTVSQGAIADAEAARVAEMEQGLLSGHMQVVDAQLCDARGQPATSFTGAEPATLTIRLRAARDVCEPNVVLDLRNAQGTYVYGASSSLLHAPIGEVAGGAEILLSFPLVLNLCPGVYTMHITVEPFDGGVMMDRRENAVTFEIVGDRTAWGIADLQAAARVQLLPAHA